MRHRVQLVPKGEFAHREGLQVIGVEELERMLKGAKRHGRDIPVDFGHLSFEEGDAEAAGWVLLNSLEVRPDGLFGDVDWTTEAEEKLRRRKFKYLSPVFTHNPDWKEEGRLRLERVVSFGLTNHPNISAMKPLLNQIKMEGTMDELLSELKSLLGMPTEKGSVEPEEALEKAIGRLSDAAETASRVAELKEMLSLPEESGMAELMEELEKRLADGETESEPEPEPEAEPASEPEEEIEVELDVSVSSGEKDPAELEQLKEELASYKEREIKEKVERAIQDGNLLPAQRQWAADYAKADPAGFDRFLANSKPLLSMGDVVIPDSRPASGMRISETQERVNSLLGISNETFNNYNG